MCLDVLVGDIGLTGRLTTIMCVPVARLQNQHPLRAVDGVHADFVCSGNAHVTFDVYSSSQCVALKGRAHHEDQP